MASRIKNYFTTRKSVFYSMLILILLTLITDVINFNSAENKLVPSTLNVFMSCLFVIGWLAFAAVYVLQKEKRFVLILAIYFIIPLLFFYFNVWFFPVDGFTSALSTVSYCISNFMLGYPIYGLARTINSNTDMLNVSFLMFLLCILVYLIVFTISYVRKSKHEKN